MRLRSFVKKTYVGIETRWKAAVLVDEIVRKRIKKAGVVIGESMVVVVYGVVAGRCVFVTDAKCELAKNTVVYVACVDVGKCAKAGNANMMTGR